jgi:N-methylhydantoinase B
MSRKPPRPPTLDRDPALVQWDVTEEYISRYAARTQYGVVLEDDFSVDEAAIRQLRQKLLAQRGQARGA